LAVAQHLPALAVEDERSKARGLAHGGEPSRFWNFSPSKKDSKSGYGECSAIAASSSTGREIKMTVFMVERDLRGITMDALAAAQQAAIRQGQTMTAAGTPVRYIRSTFAPADGRCFCLFEGADAAAIRTLNDDAKIPYSRVVEALDLTP
jgi:hypothetical protein